MKIRTVLGIVAASATMTSCAQEPVSAPLKNLSRIANEGTIDPCASVATDSPMPTDPCPPQIIDGRMTGGGRQIIIGDVRVTRGFTIHCDITLSNNIEINWPGNRWHLDKPITSANCIDDPTIAPEPPAAPFDTFIGVAIGRLNGVDGYRLDFTFADAGEPGGKNDRAALRITAPNGDVVLNVPYSFTDGGNIQAHYDQPHK